jgi:hypothetical protein
MRFGPRNAARFHTALGTLRPRRRGYQDGFELHGVKVPPRTLWSMIVPRPVLTTLGTTHRRFPIVLQPNPDLLPLQRKFDIHNLPGAIQTQQPTVVF